MAFDPDDASKLLAACHRRCCVCHRFCGVKMELDHMEQRADKGSDDIDNAIPVCFECHAEIHLYNDRHPRGRKFRPAELRLHKDQWLKICRDNPLAIIDNPRVADVGPLHSLIDELEFNLGVAQEANSPDIGCPFEVRQFDRSVDAGLVSLLEPDIRDALLSCYRMLKRANARLQRAMALEDGGMRANAMSEAQQDVMQARALIDAAHGKMLSFLAA